MAPTPKSPARQALEDAHTAVSGASGRLALILESGRGLTPTVLRELAAAFQGAAEKLLSLTAQNNAKEEAA